MYLFVSSCIFLYILLYIIVVFLAFILDDLPSGTIILAQNGLPSKSYSSGIIRVYDNGWGNICGGPGSGFGQSEANVVCHQLGHTGAASYSYYGEVRYDFINTVQDDLLAGVIFGGFVYGKKLADFILAILCHVPLSMLRLKKWWILYWQFLHRTANCQY